MSIFKRISATFTASVDNVVSKVENHDAIIDASIKECRQAAARTRVRLSKVQRDGEQMRQQYERSKDDISLWQKRAVETAQSDQQKALQCVKRKQTAEKDLERLQESLNQHRETERRVGENLKAIESRVGQITQQRNTMRTRQSAAEAARIISRLEGDQGDGIEETFDRWESALIENEISTEVVMERDPLETEFVAQEEEADLKVELDKLTGSKGQTGE